MIRIPRRLLRKNVQAGRRNFAGVRDVALQRNKALQTSYPGLFNPGNFQKDQAAHISGAFANQKKLIGEWNKKAQDMQERGIRFFYEIGGEKSIEALPEFQPPPEEITEPQPLTTPERDWATLEKRFEAGEKLVGMLDWLKDETNTVFDVEHGKNHEKNLKLMAAMDTLDSMDDWLMKLETEADVWKGCAIPASEDEYGWWLYEWKKKCEFVGNQEHGSSKSHLIAWDKLTAEESKALKAHLEMRETTFWKEVVQKNDPSVKKEKWLTYRAELEKLWDPKDLEHHNWCDYTKDLFRAAYWQGADRVQKVEKEFARMLDLIKNSRESEVDIMRATYEKYPDLKFRPEASQHIQAKDLLSVAKMLVEIRTKVETSTFQRAVRDVMKPWVQLCHKAERAGLERGVAKHKDNKDLEQLGDVVNNKEMTKDLWSEPGVYAKHLKELDRQEKEFNAEPLTLEEVAAEVIPRFCWMKADDPRKAKIEAFQQAVVQYCKKGGKLAQLDKMYWDLMPNNNGEEFDTRQGVGPSDHDHIHYFVKYHEVRETLPQYWAIASLLESDEWEFTGGSPFSEEGKLNNVKLIQDALEVHGVDPVCLNLLKVLITDGETGQLEEIFKEFKACVQKFNGEVHGTVSSAEEMSDADYNAILSELKKANPSKKFFFTKKVDPSLLAGFVVKAGVQTLDYSLLQEVESFKKGGKEAKSGGH